MENINLKLYNALKQISKFESPERLRRYAERNYGLGEEEAVDMAYENIITIAKYAIKGIRIRKLTPAKEG